MHTLDDLTARLKAEDRILYLTCLALRRLKGTLPDPYAAEILAYLDSRYTDDYIPRYIRRCHQLSQAQTAFEASGRYSATKYSEVTQTDDDDYRLALLLSFITTHHRFEILESLVQFLQAQPSAGAPRHILSIGFGSGYEVKLIQDNAAGWEIFAFDNSAASHAYASDLLRYFERDTQSLHSGTFPLETDEGIEPYLEKFGKIVTCEVLEHLERPADALLNLRRVLHPEGTMYLTMAINIAQEDHIFQYKTADEARQQVIDAGFRVLRELSTPVTISPLMGTADRENLRKGNYVCIVQKA
jgi:SAM-dependent methyltransferase